MGFRILISGASGTVGADLVPRLKADGHQVVRLTRGPAGPDAIIWDPSQAIGPESVAGFDAVIHLAGESIIGRWTEAKKRRIIESRASGTRRLAEALARSPGRPKVLVSASAIGYYGGRGDEILREDSGPGRGFTAETCAVWEAATSPAEEAGIRTAHLRIGVVLSSRGGALQKMLLPYRLGLGGRIGNGRQWWSWIQVHDLAGAIQHVLTHDVRGAVNAVSPNPVSNAEFTRTLAAALSRPAVFPMPAPVVRLIFGQMGEELWLASQRVVPAKLLESGYRFQYPDLSAAIQECLKLKNRSRS